MTSLANKESLDKRCQGFKIVGKVVCKRNEKGIENPYTLYNLFGLKLIMMQWKTFFVVALGLDNSKRHIRSKIKKSNMRQSRGNRCLHSYKRQKRERGSETIYAENVRMWASGLVEAKKCKGG